MLRVRICVPLCMYRNAKSSVLYLRSYRRLENLETLSTAPEAFGQKTEEENHGRAHRFTRRVTHS